MWCVVYFGLFIDSILLTVRLPFVILALVPEEAYYEGYDDFLRRYIGLHSGLQSGPMVALQFVATYQLGTVTDAFILSVGFSLASAVYIVCKALSEVVKDLCKVKWCA